MLGSLSRLKLTNGREITGSASAVVTRYPSPLLISIRIGREQWAQAVSMTAARSRPVNCPCTKGNAIASMPQAAYRLSPEANLTRCGVWAAVAGYAQSTLVPSLR